jgi:hypothetical protein
LQCTRASLKRPRVTRHQPYRFSADPCDPSPTAHRAITIRVAQMLAALPATHLLNNPFDREANAARSISFDNLFTNQIFSTTSME